MVFIYNVINRLYSLESKEAYMKTAAKFISLALMLVIIVFSMLASNAEVIVYIRGDANNDTVVSIKDVTTVQRVIAQLQDDPNGEIARRAGVTVKNRLSVSDATAIQAYLAEFENTYKIGKEFHYDPYELPVIP